MTDSTGLRGLKKAARSEALDEVHPQNPEPLPHYVVAPQEPSTRDGWLPRLRGHMQPVLGHVGDERALRALATSGRGWLHEDGRLVACGTFDSIDALRIVPDMEGVFDVFDADKAAVEARIDAEIAEFKAANGYEADTIGIYGISVDNVFLSDDQEYGYTDNIRGKHPEPCPIEDITRAGWISLNLRRDTAFKVVSAGREIKDVSAHNALLRTMCQHFDCHLETPVAPKPTAGALDLARRSDRPEGTTHGAVPSGEEEAAYTNDNEPSLPTPRF
ncbi:hypothetical protein QO001_006102 [Methylobacterium brachiatum]|uniref:Uncharacterized protein n=1 Tax=Methylobacterium brachiatum TaxID=269660 RepID=A0AAJ1TYA4_9HYPH|nr:hypothetical protein [Methylobacterium brachiatum]MCB4805873.1 hypothetical protein [Methylobacterium brachiatum]MDQ0547146.1 hypothetical protein [Methylobacterium brachiatum]